jgi:DNA-binding CsgD family transcriptional regulator
MTSFQLLPIVSVEGRPVLAAPLPAPATPWWLLRAAKRSTPLGERHGRLLTHAGRVVGLGVGDRPVDPERGLGRERRALRDPTTHTVVLEGDQVVSATHPRYLTPAFRRHVVAQRGIPSLWGPHLVRWRTLNAGRSCAVVTLEPVQEVPEPDFGRLTRSQMETVLLATTGGSVRDIAVERGCGVETVRSHLRAVYRQLGCSTRVELMPVVEEWHAWDRMLASSVVSPLERTRPGR